MGALFLLRILQTNSGDYKQKTKIKGQKLHLTISKIKRQKLRLTIRKYQDVSRYTILEYWGVSGRIKTYHYS
jgi:hypothetical protein